MISGDACRELVEKLYQSGVKDKRSRMLTIVENHVKLAHDNATTGAAKKEANGMFASVGIEDFYHVAEIATSFSNEWRKKVKDRLRKHFDKNQLKVTNDERSKYLKATFIVDRKRWKKELKILFPKKEDFAPIESAIVEAKNAAEEWLGVRPDEPQQVFVNLYEEEDKISNWHRDWEAMGPSVVIPLEQPHDTKMTVSREPAVQFYEEGKNNKRMKDQEPTTVVVPLKKMLLFRQYLSHAYLGMEGVTKDTPRFVLVILF